MACENTYLNKKNPLSDVSRFKNYNVDNLLKEWDCYLLEGIKLLREFFESILNKINGIRVDYYPYFEGYFLPFFVIRMSETVSIKKKKEIHHNLYYKAFEFSTDNGISPIFDKIGFSLTY